MTEDVLRLGKREFRSRLLVGTGKYESLEVMRKALAASGCEVVTVAVRRAEIGQKHGGAIMDYIDRARYKILPNTAGCYTSEDAIRAARLARELSGLAWVKLEVLGDRRTLLPDPAGTLRAAETLVKDGFVVLPYTSDDPVTAKRLEDLGCICVMPAGSPIGSGQGVLNPNNIRIIIEQSKVPVIVDAGVGTASDITQAFELGCDGVLLNTGIAGARAPVGMAAAMKHAAEAGRLAFLAGRIPKRLYATASSPEAGVIGPAERRR